MNRRECLPVVAVFAAVLALMLFSASMLPLTWDEGEMNDRADVAAEWMRHVVRWCPGGRSCFPDDPDGSEEELHSLNMLVSYWGLKMFWTGTVSEEGHPQFPVLLVAGGKFLCPSVLPFETRLRFGPVLWFSVALACSFHRLRKEFGIATAIFGVLSILLVPRLFAHAMIAVWDSSLLAAWLLAWACFPRNMDSDRKAVGWGVLVGIACASKFPGWLTPLPFLVWILCRRRWDRSFDAVSGFDITKRILAAGFTAMLVFFLLNPPLWFDPVDGFKKFVFLNTNRSLDVSIQFLGGIYNLQHSLPWYNTIFWTLITVPLGLLILAAFGIVETVRSDPKRWAGILLLLNMSTLLIVRAIPGTPVHDGVRLFVAAFPFLAILSGIGAAAIWTDMKRKSLVIFVYGFCVFNMFWFAPQWLSFYNIAIGGLPGAVRLGMEPTYYWDALDGKTLDWIARHVKPDEKIVFSYPPKAILLQMQLGRLRSDIDFVTGDLPLQAVRDADCRWYVMQRRPGLMFDRDWELIRTKTPVYVKTIRNGGFGPWDLGSVPLIEIYDLK